MIQLFRRFFASKIGIGFTLAFLVLIALAFASSDVASTGTFGGIAGDNNVAVVGDERIGTGEFTRTLDLTLDQVREQDPSITMAEFIRRGGMDEVLGQVIDRRAISLYGKEYGFRAGTNLVNSEIRAIPAFRGPDGSFSESAYRQVLAQRRLSDEVVRGDLADGLLAKQVLVPASFGARLPAKVVRRYAALARERRQGAIATVPSMAFAPKDDPTVSQLASFYQSNRGDFVRPERRVLRYATFGAEALGDIGPSEAEIAARYRRDRAQYAAQELRTVRQLVVPTRQAAQSIRQSVQGGASLQSAAQRAGLQVTTVGPLDRKAMASETSAAIADAVFAAARGSVAAPARGPLGWYVMEVASVETRPARSLAQVRDDIADTLRAERLRTALSELAGSVEERFDEGESLSDVARELELDLQATQPLLASGEVYGSDGERVPDVLAPALASAFEMQEGEPQIAEVAPGTFLVFETSRIVPSAAPPLREIREEVTFAWRMSEGSKRARAAADRILAKLDKGQTLAAALAAEDVNLPAPEQVNLTREEVAGAERIPPPLALLFSMARGTAKKLEAQGESGWYVVKVDAIEPGRMAARDPLLAEAGAALGQLAGREYSEQLRVAMREELGVERNPDALEAVRKQLTGTGEN